jgi:hypothetical protein
METKKNIIKTLDRESLIRSDSNFNNIIHEMNILLTHLNDMGELYIGVDTMYCSNALRLPCMFGILTSSNNFFIELRALVPKTEKFFDSLIDNLNALGFRAFGEITDIECTNENPRTLKISCDIQGYSIFTNVLHKVIYEYYDPVKAIDTITKAVNAIKRK